MKDETPTTVAATCDICGKPTATGHETTPVLNDPDSVCCNECFEQYVTRARTALAENDAKGMMDLAHEIIGKRGIPRRRIERYGRAAAFTKVNGLALAMKEGADWSATLKHMSNRLVTLLSELDEAWETCEDVADIIVATSSSDEDLDTIVELVETTGYDLYSIKTKIEDDVLPEMDKVLDIIKRLPKSK